MTNTVWWLLDEHGLIVAFVLLFLEESGLPPVIPGDLLMVLVGVQAAQGRFWLPVGLLALELATMLGGSVLYWLSSLGGHAIVHRVGRHVGATPERLHRLNMSLERHGQGAIIVGRLIPSLCILTAVAAGLLGYPYRRFLPALAVGGLLHLLIFVLLGYWVGRPVLRILSTLHPPFELTAAALALAWPREAALLELDSSGAFAGKRTPTRLTGTVTNARIPVSKPYNPRIRIRASKGLSSFLTESRRT